MSRLPLLHGLALAALAIVASASDDTQAPAPPVVPVYPDAPKGAPPSRAVENSEAATADAMKPYVDAIADTDVTFAMVPIPGGTTRCGSPATEPGRKDDEGPQHDVAIEPFWMGRCEVTWDEYHVFQFKLDLQRRASGGATAVNQDRWADAVSRPTPPYVPMDFEMGTKGCPAICMTQFAARHYTKWLSMKTGRFYRLPTEAEWEHACRAGTTTAYSFGDDPAKLDEYAWSFANSDGKYHAVGTKKPNPWGLHDMHGNVSEWVLDRYDAAFYATLAADAGKPAVAWPDAPYPHVVRGGSWDDDPERLRSAARRASSKAWKVQDPQLPKSIWYLTDARFVGFRVVRPLRAPTDDEKRRAWEPDVDEIRQILEKQRQGGR